METGSGEASEVVRNEVGRGEMKISLVEIGPRVVMSPVLVLESSFGGPVIYENKHFVSPNQLRSEVRLKKAGKYARRSEEGVENKLKKSDLGLQTGSRKRRRVGDELEAKTLFA